MHSVDALEDADSSDWSGVPSTLVGTVADAFDTGLVSLPPQIAKEGSQLEHLRITSVLSSNNYGQEDLVILNYRAMWGKEASYGQTFSNMRVGVIKM